MKRALFLALVLAAVVLSDSDVGATTYWFPGGYYGGRYYAPGYYQFAQPYYPSYSVSYDPDKETINRLLKIVERLLPPEGSGPSLRGGEPPREQAKPALVDALKVSCVRCHSGGDPKGGLDLSDLSKVGAEQRQEAVRRVFSKDQARVMPPPPAKPLTREQALGLAKQLGVQVVFGE